MTSLKLFRVVIIRIISNKNTLMNQSVSEFVIIWSITGKDSSFRAIRSLHEIHHELALRFAVDRFGDWVMNF